MNNDTGQQDALPDRVQLAAPIPSARDVEAK